MARSFLLSIFLHGLLTLGLFCASPSKKQDPARIEVQVIESFLSSSHSSEPLKSHKSLIQRAILQKKIAMGASSKYPEPRSLTSFSGDEDPKNSQDQDEHSDSFQNAEAAESSEAMKSSLRQNYYEEIRKRVSSRKAYPRIARMQGLQGQVVVSFLLSKEGLILESKVASTSGHEILDHSALEAVEMAQPFPAFPTSFSSMPLWMEITLVYSLMD